MLEDVCLGLREEAALLTEYALDVMFQVTFGKQYAESRSKIMKMGSVRVSGLEYRLIVLLHLPESI